MSVCTTTCLTFVKHRWQHDNDGYLLLGVHACLVPIISEEGGYGQHVVLAMLVLMQPCKVNI